MHPYLHFLGRDFPAYGVMCALGILVALALALARVRRAGLRLDAAFVLFTSALSCGLIGAALVYGWVTYGCINPLDMLTGARNPGFVFYGGVLFGFPAAWLVARILRLPFLRFANAVAPAIPLGHALGRVGCFLAGCCYGAETSLPIGVVYPAGHVTGGAAVLPIQLIEAACLLLICCLLLMDSRRHPSRTAALYVGLYAVLRFLLEFGRGDAVRGALAGLSTSQWVSLALLTCLYVLKKKRARA